MILGFEVFMGVDGTSNGVQAVKGNEASKKGKQIVGTSKRSKKKAHRQLNVEANSSHWNSIQKLVGNKILLGINAPKVEAFPDSPQECSDKSSDDQRLVKETAQSQSADEVQGEKL